MPHFCTRASFVVLAAASLAACATPQYPVAEGQAPREPMAMPSPSYPIVQPQDTPVASDDAAPATAPAGTVQTSTLPPPAAVSTQPLEPLKPAAPVTTTRTIPVAAGKVVEAEGRPQTYEVQPGEGLDAIARRVGTTRKVLADANDLEEPYRLRPGQKLKGPATKSKAYVVEKGDTLYAISRRFSVRADDIAAENGIEVASSISVGQKLLLPEGYKDKGPQTRTITVNVEPPPQTPVPVPSSTPMATTTAQPPAATATPSVTTTTAVTPPPAATPTPSAIPPAAAKPYAAKPYTPPATKPVTPAAKPPAATVTPKPYTPPATATVTPKPYTPPAASTAKPLVTSSPPPTDNDVATAGRGRFVWPVTGDVLSAFGPKGGGQRNDGINIRASSGAAVRAAAGGEVVYAGDQVPGFGNLVLVKHDGGWVTAYAHLSRVDVKMRDTVSQGQQIGAVGSTGGVGESQLHFEVRYAPSPQDKARPVDPQLVLPK